MKRSFIRGIWGIYDTANKWVNRKTKVDNDVLLASLNPYEPKIKVYVFGEENYKKIIDKGFEATLVDKKPYIWDLQKEQYRHKIEVWKCGLQDFDEVVYLDWDCVPACPIPDDFWTVLSNGPQVRASLYMYRSKRSRRPGDSRKVSAATFLYLRGKDAAEGIIKTWETIGRPWNEEGALSKYIDELDGGWKGVDNYRSKYESEFHILYFESATLKKDSLFFKSRRPIFFHWNRHIVAAILGDQNKENIKERLNYYYQVRIKNIEKMCV